MQPRRFAILLVTMCLVGMVVGCQRAGDTAAAEEATAAQRIGIYDSRSVAVAFAGNPEHEAQTAEALAALRAAKAGGDPQKIAEADERVWDSRKRLHRQGFGTAPVDDILALYRGQLETLKQERNLTALVSKWDKQTLKRYPDARHVDVTEDLIDVLGPNDRQRQRALAIRKHKPLTTAQVEKMIEQEMRQ